MIISVGAGASQAPLLLAAKRLGRRVLAVDRDPGAPGFAWADEAVCRSTHDTGAVLSALRKLGRHIRYRGVVARTTAPAALNTAAAIAREFGLPGLTPELVAIATAKSALREFGQAQGLAVPPGVKVDGRLDIAGMPSLPVLVKPDGTQAGKAHIRLCRRLHDLPACVAAARAASHNRHAEVAAFLEGFDATCLCRAHGGQADILTWWDELVAFDAEDRIVGLGVSVPSVIAGRPAQARGEDLVRRLMRQFPGVSALLLISCRFTWEGGPFLIEVHADLGGDAIGEVLWPRAQTQGDFFELAIRVAEGELTLPAAPAWKPTVLLQGPSTEGEAAGGGAEAAILIQRGGLRENLRRLPAAVSLWQPQIKHWPGHLAWLAGGRP